MVNFRIDDLLVYFPYDFVYPEQYAYMRQLKATLDAKGHCVLEMPTGTGKTVALFALITAYQYQYPALGKFLFCTRTVPEMEKALEELRGVVNYRCAEVEKKRLVDPNDPDIRSGNPKVLGMGLSARRNLCVHPNVIKQVDRDKIDEACRQMTAPWVRQKVTQEFEGNNRLPATFEDDDGIPMTHDRGGRLCSYYENLERFWTMDDIPDDVYKIEEFRMFGRTGVSPIELAKELEEDKDENTEDIENAVAPDPSVVDNTMDTFGQRKKRKRLPVFCPYFASRRLIKVANIVVLNYQYVLDPKVSEAALGVERHASGDARISVGVRRQEFGRTKVPGQQAEEKEAAVLVFDEAHNIDNVCIEALSVNITTDTLNRSRGNLRKLETEVNNLKERDERGLMEEYERLVRSIRPTDNPAVATRVPSTDSAALETSGEVNINASGTGSEQPSGSSHLAEEYETYLSEHFGNPLLPREQELVKTAVPGNIRKAHLFILMLKKIIHFLSQYIRVFNVQSEGPLTFLKNFEKATGIDSSNLKYCYSRLKSLFTTIQLVNLEEFTALTVVADFCTLVGTYWEGFIIITDPYPEVKGVFEPVIQLCCLDSSLAMQAIVQRYQSIVLTSGTISPLPLYPKLLNFQPVITHSFPMSLDRKCICPMVVAKSADQIPLSSRFQVRDDPDVIGNYGKLLIEFAKIVPDGLVCFFTSYAYMENVICKWYEGGVLSEILKYKLIMMETKDVVSTTLALHNYKRCCDCGRGAVFFSVARGKVAEGVDFDRHYGRAVILIGVPYQYTLSRVLKARLEYLREHFQVPENEFLSFDAMRQAAQCVGRVIRSKTDYGLMVFADFRYGKTDKREKIPEWILRSTDKNHWALSLDLAVTVAKKFLLSMSQPYVQTNKSRLDQAALEYLHKLSQKTKSQPQFGTAEGLGEIPVAKELPDEDSKVKMEVDILAAVPD